MPIFIAKDFDGNIESIVLAKNEKLVNAFWQGQEIYAHSITTFNEAEIDEHITGVLPIIKTKIRKVRKDEEVRIICK